MTTSPSPKISLCIITGNEASFINRFLDSFGPAFDELCIVRAVGNCPHDKTISLAKEWCDRNGRPIKIAEYRNAGWHEGITPETPVDEGLPATWPHIDDFAAARNMAWRMGTGDWLLWADLDDVLAPGSTDLIRLCSTGGDRYELFYFHYAIRTSGEHNFRERMWKRGISRWGQPLHETCRPIRGDETVRACYEPKVIYSHEPDSSKQRDPMRNRRILAYNLRYLDAFAVELQREWAYDHSATKSKDSAEKATRWAEVAQVCNILPAQRVNMLLNQAEIVKERDIEHAIQLAWSALQLMPWHRDPWGYLAEYELKAGRAKRAVFISEFMGKLNPLPDNGMPSSERFYSWRGMHLHVRALRAAGNEEQARKVEDVYFAKYGKRFTLLHASRGRPEQALKTRDYFFMAAVTPLGVEHIFAIDEDDTESLEKLGGYRHVIVKNPNGCVKAWNTAAEAASGAVLVQLSDDWLPCLEWDERCWLALEEEAKNRGEKPVAETPLVLAISDNHRRDALLCMAILTRARYRDQGNEVFSGEYFGVFSDNEFTVRAYRDGVVVPAHHLTFDHQHPIFAGKPIDEWDATHRRQNDPERYREGLEVFQRRNPDAQTG
jgi:hypothetical protein